MNARSYHTVAAHLPFALDDTVQANEAFIRWHDHAQQADKELVDLWTYCFVYRYFLTKFATSKHQMARFFDQLIERTFVDIQKYNRDIREPGRYTGWVSKVCRHTFINYLRLQRSYLSLDGDILQVNASAVRPEQSYDAALVYQTVCTAIDALPAFLCEVTRLRVLDNLSYEEIQARTGKPLAILRAYVNRGVKQLRQDADIQALLGELID